MYQQIVVIGTGRVASRTLEAVLRLPDHPHVIAVEPEVPLTSALAGTCRRHGIPCSRITSRDALVRFFEKLPARTLVLSAHNVFLFPAALAADERLTIVNFHNSLLPRHRGRNAPSWALFEMDPWAGISWHRVNAAIDEGNILCQRRIQPDWNTTALGLTQTLVDLGLKSLEALLPDLLAGTQKSARDGGRRDACTTRTPDLVAGTLKSTPQDSNVVPAFHRSSEVPNQGILDPSWPLAQASAFLRALDFGKLPLFPQPRVRLDGKERLITGYRLTAETDDAALDRHARQSAAELRYCDAGLRLTVSLASPAAVSVHHQPVLSQG